MQWRYGLVDKIFGMRYGGNRKRGNLRVDVKQFPQRRRGRRCTVWRGRTRPHGGSSEDFVVRVRMVLFLDKGMAGPLLSSGLKVPDEDPE
jgi:hypothetical protein